MKHVSLLFILMMLLGACGNTDNILTPTATISVTQLASNTPLPPAPTGQPSDLSVPMTQELVVWFPEILASADRPEMAELLNVQLNDFVTGQDNLITIQFRLRRYADAGGILPTLRSANRVAPGALPDVTLVRREDLPTLIQEGLAMPLEGQLSSNLIGNLFPPALQAGRWQNQLYAIPYLLEIQLLAYYPDETIPTLWSFANILEANTFWNFPAGRPTGLNTTFFLQYLGAGGRISEEGILLFDRDALQTVLTYYEQAYAQNLIDETMLNFTSSNDYIRALVSGELRAAMINSTAFLTEGLANAGVRFTSVPSVRNAPITLLNGWVWIVTAKNAEHQETAFRFIDWMLGQNRHADYSQQVNMLPSQRGALNRWTTDNLDIIQLSDMLNNAVLIPPDNNTSPLARAMQTAFVSVISGNATAQEATDIVANQFGA